MAEQNCAPKKVCSKICLEENMFEKNFVQKIDYARKKLYL